jgi:signal transduction histidine kinase
LKQTTIQRKFQAILEEMRKSLTVSIPHEMLTPLSGILGATNILLDEQWALNQKEIHDMARIIQHSANRLHRLIQNYVVYTQLDLAEKNPLYSGNFLQARRILMRDSCAYLKAIIESTSTEAAIYHNRQDDLSIELEEGQIKMLEDDIKKIIYELASNACKFSKKGDTVRVMGQNMDKGYQVTIVDRGLGMKKEQVDNLGAFIQYDRKAYEQQGAGLGLIVARRLTEIYGGSFHLESAPGAGTTVRVLFPHPQESCDFT